MFGKVIKGFGNALKANTAIQKGAHDLYKFNNDIKSAASKMDKEESRKVFDRIRAVDSDFDTAMSSLKKKDIDYAGEVNKYYKDNSADIAENIDKYKQASDDIASAKNNRERFSTLRETLGYNNTVYGNASTAANVAGNYFFGEGAKNSAIRLGTAAGIVGGVSVANRALNGGTLTTNRNGEKDIAGIPFI